MVLTNVREELRIMAQHLAIVRAKIREKDLDLDEAARAAEAVKHYATNIHEGLCEIRDRENEAAAEHMPTSSSEFL